MADLTNKTEKVDIDGLTKLNNRLNELFIDTFRGIPVRLDEKLKGNSWYVAVSPDIYQELLKRKIV